MFEHFGFRDAMQGLWRYKLWILAVAFFCGCLGILGAYVLNRNAEDWTTEIYTTSKTYYMEFEDQTQMQNETKNAATTLNTVLDADFCMDYVTEKMVKEYGKEKLSDRLGVALEENEFPYTAISSYVKHSVLADNHSVNIYVSMEDEALSESIMAAYDDYVQEFVTSMENVKAVDFGGIHKSYAGGEDQLRSKKKMGLLFGVAGFAGACIVVFFITLFCPVINRKSDFDEYGLHVFGKM